MTAKACGALADCKGHSRSCTYYLQGVVYQLAVLLLGVLLTHGSCCIVQSQPCQSESVMMAAYSLHCIPVMMAV
jgi:hypothetical protein